MLGLRLAEETSYFGRRFGGRSQRQAGFRDERVEAGAAVFDIAEELLAHAHRPEALEVVRHAG